MTERYIRSQTFNHTGSHEERFGPLAAIARSCELYHTGEPLVAFTDIPKPDSTLLLSVFPSLSKGVTSVAEKRNLNPISVPGSIETIVLEESARIQLTIGSIIEPLHSDRAASLVVFVDAEWNVSRTLGVSCIQIYAEHQPNKIFILRVSSAIPRSYASLIQNRYIIFNSFPLL
jgi:hypothetical protein